MIFDVIDGVELVQIDSKFEMSFRVFLGLFDSAWQADLETG